MPRHGIKGYSRQPKVVISIEDKGLPRASKDEDEKCFDNCPEDEEKESADGRKAHVAPEDKSTLAVKTTC